MWSYHKIYAQKHNLGTIVRHIGKVAWELREHALSQRWHFLRYEDDKEEELRSSQTNVPRLHLRVRYEFDIRDKELVDQFLIRSFNNLEGCTLDIQRGEYQPETDKFGGTISIEKVHDIFCWSSDFVYRYEGDIERCVAAADLFVALCQKSETRRIELYRERAQRMYEFWQIAIKDRKRLSELAEERAQQVIAKFRNADYRKSELASIIRTWQRPYEDESKGADRLINDIQHMHFNRTGLSYLGEAVALECLSRCVEWGMAWGK